MQAKRALGRGVVQRFWDAEAASDAEAAFDRLHVEREAPQDVQDAEFEAGGAPVHVPALIADVFGVSRSEGRRLIEQGGVKLDGRVLAAQELDLDPSQLDGAVLQLGKRRHRRLRAT